MRRTRMETRGSDKSARRSVAGWNWPGFLGTTAKATAGKIATMKSGVVSLCSRMLYAH